MSYKCDPGYRLSSVVTAGEGAKRRRKDPTNISKFKTYFFLLFLLLALLIQVGPSQTRSVWTDG